MLREALPHHQRRRSSSLRIRQPMRIIHHDSFGSAANEKSSAAIAHASR